MTHAGIAAAGAVLGGGAVTSDGEVDGAPAFGIFGQDGTRHDNAPFVKGLFD